MGLRRGEAAVLHRVGLASPAARSVQALGAGGAFRGVLRLVQRSLERTYDTSDARRCARRERRTHLPRARLFRGRPGRATQDGAEPISGSTTLRGYRWEARARPAMPGDYQLSRVGIRAAQHLQYRSRAVGWDYSDSGERSPRFRPSRCDTTTANHPALG